MQIDIRADASVRAAIAAIGRTEDVHFSPSNTRLAVAGFRQNSILVLSVRALQSGVDIDYAVTVNCADFALPHGVFWLSETRLAVGNREGGLAIVDVPHRPNGPVLDVSPQLVLRSAEDAVMAPGSVTGYRPAPGLLELLVCNNTGHYISRHLLRETADDELSLISTDIVARSGLNIPDGVACDPTLRWAAVSNHEDHSAYVYRMADFGHSDRPAAVLRGMSYAHGVRFAAGGRVLFIADAGQPFIHVYCRPGDQWAGELTPAETIRAVDQEVFTRGRANDEEGGPKGIDITADGKVLAVSCHEQPLAFFDVEALLQRLAPHEAGAIPTPVEPAALLMERLQAVNREAASLRSELAPLRQLSATGYWRLVSSFRAVAHRLRGVKARS